MIQKEAKKAIKALTELHQSYFGVAHYNNDHEYVEAFNAMMNVLRRIEHDN